MFLTLVLKNPINVTLGDIANIKKALRKAGYGVRTIPDEQITWNPKAIKIGKV